MNVLFSAALLLLACYYAAVLGLFAVGFRRVRRVAHAGPGEAAPDALPFVSVVIAARNEEASIGECLERVLTGSYPPDRYEVIVVDDGSTDGTAEVVRRLQRRHRPALVPAGDATGPDAERLRLVTTAGAGSSGQSKPFALARGIEAARGSLILTTDADCRVGRHWMRAMVGAFTPRTAFVSGPVRYHPAPSFFGRMQALEFLGLVAVGGGAIGVGRPNLCNSANIAYRRDVYDRLGRPGLDRPAGPGHDEVLLQRIAAETAWDVHFCARPAAVVDTDPARDVRAFMDQRRRWARQALHYPGAALTVMLVALYGCFVALLAGLLAAPFVPGIRGAVVLAFGLKTLADLSVLVPACRHFGQQHLLRVVLPAQPLHVLYLVLAVAGGALGDVHWKDRRIR